MSRRFLLAALACGTLAQPAPAEVRVRDDAGTEIVLAQPARRIVSLAPHATELVFAAGAGDRLVGVLAHSDHPPAARALPVIGAAGQIDVEAIVALKPDLVVTWPWTAPAQEQRLRAFGIPVMMTLPRAPDDIAGLIERVGELAGTQDVAARAARDFRERMRDLTRRRPPDPPVLVFYQISGKPMFTLGGDHLVTQAIALCGGRNVFGALSLPAPEVDVERVVAAQPELIVAGATGGVRPAWLDAWQRWPELPAVARGQLVTVDADLMHRPGPRFVEGVAVLCEALERARRARRPGKGGS